MIKYNKIFYITNLLILITLFSCTNKENTKILFTLNGTNHYVILRNFEELPEKFQQKDLDILTENTLMKYIIDFDCSLNVKENHFFV